MYKILWSFSDSSTMEVVEFTVSASFKLAEVCLENLSFEDGIDLICLAIKLLFSSIQQWHRGPVEDENNDKVKKDCVRKLSEKLICKLKRTLPFNMPDNYWSDALKRELQVRITIVQWYLNPIMEWFNSTENEISVVRRCSNRRFG